MRYDRCCVYMLDDSFDARNTHTPDFIRNTTRYICLHKQSILLREYSIKWRFRTFYYPSMLSSSVYTSAARNVVLFFWIWTSDLLSRLGYVSKLSRLNSADRPRRWTTAPSIDGLYLWCQLHSLNREPGARNALQYINLLAKTRNLTPLEITSIFCIILLSCLDFSHVHLKQLPPRFVRNA